MTDPAASVVVPTQNRPRRLERLLAALRAQDQPPDTFEVIVVDDGSGPATARVLEQELGRGGLRLRVVRNERAQGAAAARNTGWQTAKAPLIAFTDDDCRPAPGWLSAGLVLHAREPDKIVQGRTEPDPEERADLSLLSHTIRRTELGPSYETCNIFYPRALLESLGGFDARYGPQQWPAGEDTDLAWRALESGRAAAFAPEALVFHAVERVGALGKLRQATRWTSSIRVLADHPQARVMLDRGIFWNVWHYLLWRSALALLGPRWLRKLVLRRHLLALRRRGREAGAGAWSVPFLLAYDAVEVVAILRGAIRYRTLVL
jgi:GT2 family glycosyltransferase